MSLKIQDAKLELIQWLTTLEDNAVIQKLMELKKTESKDWWLDASEEEKKSIELGLADAKEGKVKPQSDAKKIYGKWL